jgi:histidinol phosphatase-like enzyme
VELDLTNFAVIGDMGSTDLLAATAVGAKRNLVETGRGKDCLNKYRHKWYEHASPNFVAKDLLVANDNYLVFSMLLKDF